MKKVISRKRKEKKKKRHNQIPCLHFWRQENSGNNPNANLGQICILLKEELQV